MENDKILVSIAAALEKEGISAFRLDFSGNGYDLDMFWSKLDLLVTNHSILL